MPSYHVVGMTAGDMVFSMGRIASVGSATRIRGVHTGALSVVLWACKLDADFLKASMAAALPLMRFLDAVLPPNAHELCREAKVGIVLRRQNALWASPSTTVISSWPSRAALMQCVAQAVWIPRWRNLFVAPGTAAGLAVAAAAGIVNVGPQRATHPATITSIRVTQKQFDSWWEGGRSMPL